MSGLTIGDVASALGWSMVTIRQRLCVLRSRGIARAVTLWNPDRAGRPIGLLTRVLVQHSALGAMERFEHWCRQEARITRADLVTGRFDYQLWSHHSDLREAETWSRALALNADVRTCVSQVVQVRFGHSLSGAPVFTALHAATFPRGDRAA